ncbi:hypothetical protein, partial [Kitasatospora sp. NPDC005751]|uniref:hypothetical protein n=1 Tax=Kitasatospora sp. NPDC005751 TaxID=3157064 RepID=UPI0033E9D6E1
MERATVAIAAAAVFSLATPLAVADVVGGYQYTDKLWGADPLPDQAKVPGSPVSGRGAVVPAPVIPPGARELVPHVVKPVQWPAAATATVDLGNTPEVRSLAAPAGKAKAGSLPVSVSPAAPVALGARAKSLAPSVAPLSAVSSVRVDLADRGRAKRAGVDGLLVGLDRADARAESGSVAVSLDYGGIEQAYGGGWASRLQLVAMPACALTTPQLAACRTRTPIEAVNDPVGRKLSGTVVLAAAGGAAGAAKPGSA